MALKPEDIAAIKEVVSEVAHQVAGEVSQKQTVQIVHTTLEAMGMSVARPLEMQKDFAHLRKERIDIHDTKKAAKDAVIRWSITGAFSAVVAWLAVNSPIGGGPFHGN
ncbi:MAG: hypothetical protein KAI73_03675 [Rhodospirillaceae bacterium]|nr:hypothetical protein [Rhodospirillaceae bacterium]